MLPVTTFDPIQITIQNKNLDCPSTSKTFLTLHPITVEFCRLLRRQKQLNDIDNSGQSSSNDQAQRQQQYNWSIDHCPILENCTDVQNLLYATIIHYYASLLAESSEIESIIELPFSKCFEVDHLNHFYRTLCTAGTRTLLLLADKDEIIQHLQRYNDDNEQKFIETEIENSELDNYQELISSSSFDRINISNNENYLINKNVFVDDVHEDSDNLSHKDSVNCNKSNQKQHPTRAMKINFILNIKHSNSIKCSSNNNNDTKNVSSKTLKFLEDFDKYVDRSLERKRQLNSCLKNFDKNIKENNQLNNWIGLEQQIIGAITFFKRFCLEGVKIMEITLLAVQNRFQRSGIGTKLIKCLKENIQIGPYDLIHVHVPGQNIKLVKFFLKNNFTDDLILNASFDQLIIRNDDDDEYLEDLKHETNYDPLRRTSLHNSTSYGQIDKNYFSLKENNPNWLKTIKNEMISMCYLPPFSVGTLSESITNHRALEKLDNRFVDDMIEQANMIWRRDLLSSYRTQWSCVARLRSEITKLRQQLSKRDLVIDQLRRENFQLRNALIHKNLTNSSPNHSLQKQLQLYKSFQFDSLDF